jgi:YHS domain-containing protein
LSLSNEAIAGFDVVSYWRKGVPEPGTRAYSVEWQGSVWLFSSAADRAAFEKEPTRYAPEFGGYCAYAMSQGIQADIHPYVFRIEGGKLYLFYSFESRDKFLADRGLEQRAEDEWQVVSERIF